MFKVGDLATTPDFGFIEPFEIESINGDIGTATVDGITFRFRLSNLVGPLTRPPVKLGAEHDFDYPDSKKLGFKNPCTCDFYTVIMRTGCACGGK
jgi:hypothetical protein